MEAPPVNGNPNPFTPTNGNPFSNFFIKKEKPDGSRQSDKVLQFTLALQRQRISEIITLGGNDDEGPTVLDQAPKTVHCVDLTQSDDEDSPTQATDSAQIQNGNQNGNQNGIDDTLNDTYESDRNDYSRYNSTTDEDDLDFLAMSSLEIQMDESGNATGFRGFGSDEERRTLPYTDAEKQVALRGNPNFDYRTKLDQHGVERYALYKCPKCPTGFPRMHHYLVHVRSHERTVGSYRCHECGLTTANSIFLANHMDRHRLQREPELFDTLQMKARKSLADKRPWTDHHPLPSSLPPKKRSYVQPSPSLYTSVPSSTMSQSPSPKEGSPSIPESSDVDNHQEPEGGTEAERIEARKGNPSIIYRVGRRSRPNGRVYARTSYKCQHCPYANEKYELYLAHSEGHKGRRPFRCRKCTFSANTQYYLDRHSALHVDEDKDKKEVARDGDISDMDATPEQEETIGTYKDNDNVVPSPEITVPKLERRRSSGATGPVLCTKCPSKIFGHRNMKSHMRQHGKLGMKLNCPHCDYASNRDDYMRNHMEAHLYSPEVAVPTLPNTSSAVEAASRPDNLTEEDFKKLIDGNPNFQYMSVSTNGQVLPVESSYKCWNCPYATNKYALLVAHQERHDSNAKYACNKCSYSANTIQGLKNHKLAHSVQHEAAMKASNAQPISFHGETPQAHVGSSPYPSAVPVSNGFTNRPETGQFFISNIRILNIMAMNAEPTVADVSTHGILKLKGNSEEGKSSYILAVMLGLGYDLCLDHRDETTSICGLNLKNAISDGKDFASIELTVSLRAFPELQREFGSQIKFSRRITRAPSELSNMIAITSADPRPQFNAPRPKVVGGKDLVAFLRKLKLSPERMRLMLLDGENVKYMMDNTQLWFELFESAVYESEIEIEQKTAETNFLLERLKGRDKLQRERLQWFQSRLEMRPPMDTEKIRKVSQEDWTNHKKCTMEMNHLATERQDLEQKLRNYADQQKNGTDGYLLRMRTVFEKFLQQLNYSGEIMLDEDNQEFAICIWKSESKEPRPATMDAVTSMWKTLSNGKRRIAVIGLYLALWEVSSYLGILAVDAFSCTEADFRIPPSCLPVAWELLNRKCVEQKQCIISLPPEY